MLVRPFRPVHIVTVLVLISIVVLSNYIYKSPQALELTPKVIPSIIHDAFEPAHDAPTAPKAEDSKPTVLDKVLEHHFNWGERKEAYPIPSESLISLPTGAPTKIPAIQHPFEPSTDKDADNRNKDRREKIKEAADRSWVGYKTHAWLKDELAVVSGEGKNKFGGWAATLIDSLDTLWIMEMKEFFEEAVEALEEIDFSFIDYTEMNTFETTIRYLGGLLSAYDLTEGRYTILLDKAIEVGDMLYASFDTPNRMPVGRWLWRSAREGETQEAPEEIFLAEIGSMSLEFTRLSQLTNNTKYYDAIQRVTNALESQQNSTQLPGLWPMVLNARDMEFTKGNEFTLSGMADSTYEYLPKQYMLLDGKSEQYRKMYEAAIDTAQSHLFYRPMTVGRQDILISGVVRVEKKENILDPQGQHLSCYIGGMMGIGSKIFDRKDDFAIAKKLLDGCIWAYENTQSSIMPEGFHTVPCPENKACEWEPEIWYKDVLKRHQGNKDLDFNEDNIDWKVKEHRLNPGFSDIPIRRYVLRPELIETIFIFYRITGDEAYRERAWRLWELIEKLTKTRYGNAGLVDVTDSQYPSHLDSMESFWLAETLKYFYLMFCNQTVLSLDEWVFNTEAHPFRRPGFEIEAASERVKGEGKKALFDLWSK